MPISGGTDAYSIAISLLGGGVVGTIITKIYEHWMKRRQERIDMARIRMDTISKAAPYYSRLAVYNCWNLAWLLRTENETQDFELMFYYLCNILYLRHKIIQTFAEIQLDNLEAEEIIGDLLRTINNLVINGLGRVETSRIEYLVENDIPFHAFHDTLQRAENMDHYNRFVEWISREEIAREIGTRCRWFTDLIMLELNHIYQPWYGEPPNLSRIDQELVSHLLTNHPNYYNRILDFRKTFFKAKHSVMIGP